MKLGKEAQGLPFLYDFGLAGGNGSTPTTAVTYPSAGADLSNPDGNITVTGTASAPDGVAAVTAQVQRDGATGPWYNQATGAFQTGQSTAEATLASPGATSTTWSLSVPVSLAGMPYQLRASAVGENNVADGTAYASASNAAAVSFNLESSPLAPVVNVSPARVVPGGNVSLSSSGFSGGVNHPRSLRSPASSVFHPSSSCPFFSGRGTATAAGTNVTPNPRPPKQWRVPARAWKSAKSSVARHARKGFLLRRLDHSTPPPDSADECCARSCPSWHLQRRSRSSSIW